MKAIIHELDHAYKDWESYVNNEEFHLYDFSKPGTRYYKSTKWTNDFKDEKNTYASRCFIDSLFCYYVFCVLKILVFF